MNSNNSNGNNNNLIPELITRGLGSSSSSALKNFLVYDFMTRLLPAAAGKITTFIGNRVKARADRMYADVRRRVGSSPTKQQERTGSIILQRDYASNATSSESNDMFDAVLSMATDLPDAKFIKRTPQGVFLIETKQPIMLTPDVWFAKLTSVEVDGKIDKMSIEVFSYIKNIVELRDLLTSLEQAHQKTRGNQLGRQLYYFDELPPMIPTRIVRDARGHTRSAPDLSRVPPNITFTMFALHTNKSLHNIYGSSVTQAKKRIAFFMNNPNWYREKGIPHTLGILMHGAPGCGKTSFIKALAKDSGRHVVNMKLSPSTTVTQINNLFYSPRVNVVRDGSSMAYDIPIDKRLIVMEDIDCLSSVVMSRSALHPSFSQDNSNTSHTSTHTSTYISNNSQNLPSAPPDAEDDMASHRLTLSVLLNILDGVLETPGRIVVMTSNQPWKLDPALVRPGRIDVCIEFQRCSAEDIMDMVEGLCGVTLNRAEHRSSLCGGEWTPAEVAKAIFENVEDWARVLEIFRGSPPTLQSSSSNHESSLNSKCTNRESPNNGFATKESPNNGFATKESPNNGFATNEHSINNKFPSVSAMQPTAEDSETIAAANPSYQRLYHSGTAREESSSSKTSSNIYEQINDKIQPFNHQENFYDQTLVHGLNNANFSSISYDTL